MPVIMARGNSSLKCVHASYRDTSSDISS